MTHVMDSQTDSPQQSSNRGCLIAAGVGIGLLILAIIFIRFVREKARRDFELNQAELRMEMFNQVKAGDDGSKSVIFDLLQIEMFADDADCVANLKMLYFSEVDLSDPHVSAAGKLTNVKTIYFYSCYNPESLLLTMKGLPSVEEVEFETSHIPDDTATLLAGFPNLKKVGIYGQVFTKSQEEHFRETLPDINLEITD
jgi:hypothetical protein